MVLLYNSYSSLTYISHKWQVTECICFTIQEGTLLINTIQTNCIDLNNTTWLTAAHYKNYLVAIVIITKQNLT